MALVASEARHRQLFENNGALQLLADADTSRILDVNAAAEMFYGWPRATMQEMFVTDLDGSTLPQWQARVGALAVGSGTRVTQDHRLAQWRVILRVDAHSHGPNVCFGNVRRAQRPDHVAHALIHFGVGGRHGGAEDFHSEAHSRDIGRGVGDTLASDADVRWCDHGRRRRSALHRQR